MEYAEALPEAAVICPKDLLHLGRSSAVYQSLSRLDSQDRLMRICRGVYVRTIETRFGRCSPDYGRVIKELSRLWGETIVHSAGSSANFLHLTTQVPMRLVYFTSGPNRQLHFRALKVKLLHAPQWQLVGEDRRTGLLIRALTFLHPSETKEALDKVLPTFPHEDMEELLAARSILPSWIVEPLNMFIDQS